MEATPIYEETALSFQCSEANNCSLLYVKFTSINKLSSTVVLSSVKLHKYLVFHNKDHFYLSYTLSQCLSMDWFNQISAQLGAELRY